MKELECIIFNVENGFCSFIKSPNNYGLLIDCGSREYFSPVKWVRYNYNFGKNNIQYLLGRRIAELIVSHLHMDHFDDVGSLQGIEKPKYLLRDKKTLHHIDEKITKEKDERNKTILKNFKKFQLDYTENPKENIDWGFDSHQRFQISYEDAKDVSSGSDKLINNRSFIVALEFAGKKILFTGDMEVEGWRKAFEYTRIDSVLKSTNFFIASHHGHKSGFTPEILDCTGIPDIYILSSRTGDPDIDPSYSKAQLSKGFLINGATHPSSMISTGEIENSIKITINEYGDCSLTPINSDDNLNEQQKKILSRRTRKIIKKWGY